MIPAIIILCSVIAYQQWFYSRQIDKLINKVMSRNYTEYVQATAPPPPRRPNPLGMEGVPEDLRALEGIGLI